MKILITLVGGITLSMLAFAQINPILGGNESSADNAFSNQINYGGDTITSSQGMTAAREKLKSALSSLNVIANSDPQTISSNRQRFPLLRPQI